MSRANHIGDCDGRNRTINLDVFETVGVDLREGLRNTDNIVSYRDGRARFYGDGG